MADELLQQETNIGPTITITGEMRSGENISVQGTIQGVIATTADIHVLEGGSVEADVTTRSIEVRGTISGNVNASDLFQVHLGGRVNGDVRAPRIVLVDGAKYKGNIDMDSGSRKRREVDE
jgi:cytoskeletal protein CcmA (bactofilin family)